MGSSCCYSKLFQLKARSWTLILQVRLGHRLLAAKISICCEVLNLGEKIDKFIISSKSIFRTGDL